MDLSGINVGVVDERGELSSMYNGQAQNNLGIRTDILDNVKKSIGMEMMIRSMAPRVIVSDEIGNEDDIKAINYAMCSGAKGIFTAHGKNIDTLKNNPIFSQILNLFERIIFLKKYRNIEVLNLDK